jgi:hypothetical protein
MESIHRFNVLRQPHNRIRTLRTGVRVLCATHGVQRVVDLFQSEKGNLLALECGCRRPETLDQEAA